MTPGRQVGILLLHHSLSSSLLSPQPVDDRLSEPGSAGSFMLYKTQLKGSFSSPLSPSAHGGFVGFLP